MSKPKPRPHPGKPPSKPARNPRRTLCWAIAGAALALMAILAIAVLPNVLGPNRTPQAVLTRYFTGLYTGAPLDELSRCFPESKRYDFELVFSFGGIGATMVTLYRNQARELVGQEVSVRVTVAGRSKPSSGELLQAKQEFPDAESATTVSFDILLSGSQGRRTVSGSTQLVRISGKWYLTDYNIGLSVQAP